MDDLLIECRRLSSASLGEPPRRPISTVANVSACHHIKCWINESSQTGNEHKGGPRAFRRGVHGRPMFHIVKEMRVKTWWPWKDPNHVSPPLPHARPNDGIMIMSVVIRIDLLWFRKLTLRRGQRCRSTWASGWFGRWPSPDGDPTVSFV